MLLLLQQIGASHQFIHRTDSQLSHILPQFLGNEIHEIDHVFRFSLKTLPKLRILRCNAHRTRVQVADAHHHAAHGYERCCRKPKLLGAQHAGNRHIAACHQLAVGLQNHFIAQTIHDQSLMRFRHSQLPWKSCIVNGVSRSCSRASVKRGNQDHLCPRFGDTRRYSSNPRFRYQLHRDSGLSVGIL